MTNEVFERFNNGKFIVKGKAVSFAEVSWSKHPVFDGVELKHLVTSKETDGQFSFHLVKVAPEKTIGNHIHVAQLETHEVIAGSGKCIADGFEIEYLPGNISVIPIALSHEVRAGKDGLYLLAKFIPALC